MAGVTEPCALAMDSRSTPPIREPKADAVRLAAERRRARTIARVAARAIAALTFVLLAGGALAAFRWGSAGHVPPLFFALAALQAAVLILCAWSALYGTQVYWALGWLEVSLARRIEARLSRRRDG